MQFARPKRPKTCAEVTIPSTQFVGVEVPCFLEQPKAKDREESSSSTVKTVDLCQLLEGSGNSLKKSFNSKKPIQFNFPGPKGSRKTTIKSQNPKKVTKILVRIRRKRPRSSSFLSRLLGGGQSQSKIATVEPVGYITSQYEFNEFPDFEWGKCGIQFDTSTREGAQEAMEKVEKGFRLNDCVSDEKLQEVRNNMFLPPARLRSAAVKEAYQFLDDSESNKLIQKRKARGPKAPIQTWTPSQHLPVPEPLPSVHKSTGSGELHSKILKLFEERPIWKRTCLLSRLNVKLYTLSECLRHCSIRIDKGPFAKTYMKYGYNPTTDVSSRKYQTVTVASLDYDELQKYRKKHGKNFVYAGDEVKQQNSFQFLDINDDQIRKFIRAKIKNPVFDPISGWFSKDDLRRARLRVKESILEHSRGDGTNLAHVPPWEEETWEDLITDKLPADFANLPALNEPFRRSRNWKTKSGNGEHSVNKRRTATKAKSKPETKAPKQSQIGSSADTEEFKKPDKLSPSDAEITGFDLLDGSDSGSDSISDSSS